MLNKAFFIIAEVTSGGGTTSYETIASDFSEINNFLFGLIQAGTVAVSLVYLSRILINHHAASYFVKRIITLVVINIIVFHLQEILFSIK